jgi:hypothetical protein
MHAKIQLIGEFFTLKKALKREQTTPHWTRTLRPGLAPLIWI